MGFTFLENSQENYLDTFLMLSTLFPSFRSRISHMDAVIRRCPFLTAVPSVYLKLAAKSLLWSYALKCPVLMDLATRPLARALSSSAAVSKGTPTNDGQVQSCDYNTPYVTVR